MRLDAHQYFTPEHTPDHLESILKRNKFDGSIAIGGDEGETARLLALAGLHSFIRGVVGCGNAGHPKLVGQLRYEVASTEQALQLADEEPGRRIAILRLGSPPMDESAAKGWARGLEKAAENPLIFCKASGLLSLAPKPWKADAIRPYLQYALRAFGPQRLMFGSEWPTCLPDAIWKETLAIFTQALGAQSMETREELLGGAAQRFYGIADT